MGDPNLTLELMCLLEIRALSPYLAEYNAKVDLEEHRSKSANPRTMADRVAYRNFATVRHLIDTFGSRETAIEWLNEFCPALGVRPVELMEDDEGRLALNRVLICISHGMIY